MLDYSYEGLVWHCKWLFIVQSKEGNQKWFPAIFFQVKRIGMVPPLLVLLAKSPVVDHIDITCVKEILVGAAPVSAQLQQEVTSRLGHQVCIRQGLLSRLILHVVVKYTWISSKVSWSEGL